MLKKEEYYKVYYREFMIGGNGYRDYRKVAFGVCRYYALSKLRV